MDQLCVPIDGNSDCPAGEHMVCANTNEQPNHCENGEWVEAQKACIKSDGTDAPPMCPNGADLICAGHHHECPQGEHKVCVDTQEPPNMCGPNH